MPRALVFTAAFFSFVAVAQAMRVSHEYSPIAYSEDGASVLVRHIGHGPEGGGEETLELWGNMPPNRLRFELSQDYSPGGTEHPQRITLGTCAQHLRELDMALKARGFADVEVQPADCKLRHGGYVKTSKAIEDRTVNARFSKIKDAAWERAGYRLTKQGNELHLGKAGAVACTMKVDFTQITELEVGGYKPGRLVWVTARYAYGDQALVGLCASGDAGKLQPLPIR